MREQKVDLVKAAEFLSTVFGLMTWQLKLMARYYTWSTSLRTRTK